MDDNISKYRLKQSHAFKDLGHKNKMGKTNQNG